MAPSDWSIERAIQYYNVAGWGAGFFSVNEKGHVVVHPMGQPGPVIDLYVDLVGAAMTLEWSHAAGADVFDLTRGSLTSLHGTGGDFSAAGSACIANDTAGRTATDAASPPAGEIYFYLPRGVNCAGRGTYDAGEPTQVGTRAALDGAANACP